MRGKPYQYNEANRVSQPGREVIGYTTGGRSIVHESGAYLIQTETGLFRGVDEKHDVDALQVIERHKRGEIKGAPLA